ncbi:hypothetical protein SOASR030_10560 [Leminorella grimontii]|uniref:Uncharacterized protein n=1 Tax=Leminorella grimontii TaxID=82981 RepID=A0AAV5N1P8_9GAMM|nr:hypothetical protein SOASR030_10560 [Leminorella grimontii]GKX61249.1 hypothetical protein SOASR031_35640 [Leminorella grimontii]
MRPQSTRKNQYLYEKQIEISEKSKTSGEQDDNATFLIVASLLLITQRKNEVVFIGENFIYINQHLKHKGDNSLLTKKERRLFLLYK